MFVDPCETSLVLATRRAELQ